jgi:hypothetical protein
MKMPSTKNSMFIFRYWSSGRFIDNDFSPIIIFARNKTEAKRTLRGKYPNNKLLTESASAHEAENAQGWVFHKSFSVDDLNNGLGVIDLELNSPRLYYRH